ncbi:hypothetical protein N658DRAFT_510776 [Parathielavia hyrcaniae]|uniref:Uncharacterized protein n=1 Tax=Parathielavia hyrcaniae TaxID=113614 RepID=A0AAN6PS87_9PEZI|nr:hypothetical protein N658DRAFT_510776 [Parathielavia hyrcaniae]
MAKKERKLRTAVAWATKWLWIPAKGGLAHMWSLHNIPLWLVSTYAPVVGAKLEALWTVLVVRGQYHRARRYVGSIDIESASEVLLRAKESLRASVARSIDDTQDIYPVVMTPANWARHLSTNFTHEDLLDEPSIVRQKLYDAEKNRAALINRRNAVSTGKQDIPAVEEAERTALKELAEAQKSMTVGFADTTMRLVKLYFEAVTKGAINRAATLLSASCLDKQALAQTASETLSQARLATADAKGKDPTNLLNQLNDQIASLTLDIDYYHKILESADNPLPAKLPKATDGEASIWQEIVLTCTKNTGASSNMSSSKVAHNNWQTGLWFWSASGSSDSAESESATKHNTTNTDIQIAFRAMKVAIQRPWMNAGILAQSSSFYRTVKDPISSLSPADTKTKLNSLNTSVPNAENSLLPSFPTSFVVVKDVHIVFAATGNFDDSFVKNATKSASSGGGFMCFSTGKSEASSDHREGAVVSSDGTHLSIKIAAPQIIGWINELVPKDNSAVNYNTYPEDEFKTSPKSD